ncbi:homoserine O-acetyltransferase MetA [Ruminococcus champanellensis]|uniref:homoserine O-acetyltransferase MetA n=1 Tax=Ruminococcus champanellensis TaxID=1161942 RepID=UPI00059D5374|nr:homoserine O-succinyltransferase [Ruminococcus champanellensis]MED9891674.1 homoserine O-succinyltransferase [Ruminococcus champanellensis]
MPIRISQDLPAYQILQNENIFVMTHDRAEQQDIRPLKILILNIMPKKIETETQILRLLSNTPLQVDIELMHVASHVSKNTSLSHLETFYTTFGEIKDKHYDGMIITGAPVEHLPYEQVDYWDEICQIMEWSKTHVFSTLHICWAAQAGLYYHFGIPKYPLAQKMFGIFPHVVEVEHSLLLKGFDECFYVPHSRNTEVRRADIEQVSQLEILTSSPMSGVHIVANKNGRQYFITGHSEYDRDTIAQEYFRDRDKGIDIQIPYHYFPEDDPTRTPRVTWRCHANLMFSNWLNYCVYQRTPYNLDELSVRNWEWEIGI